MKNIAIPGVFPLVVAMLMAMLAVRAHFKGKQTGDKRFVLSIVLCVMGACIFVLIAIFQVLEVNGISFR